VTRSQHEISEDVLEEGCYHLTQLGLTTREIANHFETTPARVTEYVERYESKIKLGEVVVAEVDRSFWMDVRREAEGDAKVTFISQRGFHHAWVSELKRLDGTALLSIFEASKDFLGTDQNSRFLDYPPPKGYDPLVLDREIRKAVDIVAALLEDKWKEQRGHGGRASKRNVHP
jgi:hypothetical protein